MGSSDEYSQMLAVPFPGEQPLEKDAISQMYILIRLSSNSSSI